MDHLCDKCDAPTSNVENDCGQILCAVCTDSAAEKAWERHCMSDYDNKAGHEPWLKDAAS